MQHAYIHPPFSLTFIHPHSVSPCSVSLGTNGLCPVNYLIVPFSSITILVQHSNSPPLLGHHMKLLVVLLLCSPEYNETTKHGTFVICGIATLDWKGAVLLLLLLLWSVPFFFFCIFFVSLFCCR